VGHHLAAGSSRSSSAGSLEHRSTAIQAASSLPRAEVEFGSAGSASDSNSRDIPKFTRHPEPITRKEVIMLTLSSDSMLFLEVQHFLARQMQRMDVGDFVGFARTFTDDGEFAHTAGRAPARTRAGIVSDLIAYHRASGSDLIQRRHWLHMTTVDPQPDGDLIAVSYALVVNTKPGQSSYVSFSGRTEDVLVETPNGLRMKSRRVINDKQLADALVESHVLPGFQRNPVTNGHSEVHSTDAHPNGHSANGHSPEGKATLSLASSPLLSIDLDDDELSWQRGIN
jgi:actinorhodin biosynthesis protein ActVIA